MKDYIKEVQLYRKAANRMEKLGVDRRAIPSDKPIQILRVSGFDVKYKYGDQIKTVRLYKGKLTINALSKTEQVDLITELDNQRIRRLFPKAAVQAAKKGSARRLKASGISSKNLVEDAAKFVREYGLDADDIDYEQYSEFDPWSLGDSETLNEFYHVFGASSDNPVSVAAYQIWKQQQSMA
jgi:hypothetical protein